MPCVLGKYKVILLFLVSAAILQHVLLASADGPATAPAAFPFSTHTGYFTSKDFEHEAPESFVILQDQAAFDRIFRPVMYNNAQRLPPRAFETHIVLAVTRRGQATWTFTAIDVARDGAALTLRYACVQDKNLQSYTAPLIISVPKSDCRTYRFVENGVLVKTLELTR